MNEGITVASNISFNSTYKPKYAEEMKRLRFIRGFEHFLNALSIIGVGVLASIFFLEITLTLDIRVAWLIIIFGTAASLFISHFAITFVMRAKNLEELASKNDRRLASWLRERGLQPLTLDYPLFKAYARFGCYFDRGQIVDLDLYALDDEFAGVLKGSPAGGAKLMLVVSDESSSR